MKSPREPKFTFKYFVDAKTMGYTRSCQDTEINEAAWTEIESARFFDIKINPAVSIMEYIPILNKIDSVTESVTDVIPVIHFSNELFDVFSAKHELMFWDSINYITHSNYELQIEYKISTVAKDTFRIPIDFFIEVQTWAQDNKIPHLKLSVLDKDDTEHEFFRK